jgi:ribosomal protein L9
VDVDIKLRGLEEKLAKYQVELSEKMKMFHGVRHENSLSELRYTQIMVLRDMIRGLEKEIGEMKKS